MKLIRFMTELSARLSRVTGGVDTDYRVRGEK